MTRLYLAGPLFCRAEREYNEQLRKEMAAAGYELLLPQDNSAAIDAARMPDPDYRRETAMRVFAADLELLSQADALLFNLDGRVPDEGACVELGWASARKIPCFGLKTDVRTAEYGSDNLMIAGALAGRTAGSLTELIVLLRAAGL